MGTGRSPVGLERKQVLNQRVSRHPQPNKPEAMCVQVRSSKTDSPFQKPKKACLAPC